MNYKETLFFIGKCLTISHEKENLKIVSKKIIAQEVNWDNVVKISTEHYVFPALYCNLLRANLLSHLPEDLVSYMKHITDQNRERNSQIIEQAKEINSLLLENGITPIFLKGAGFLLQDFYYDIAERMVGDIDFLVNDDSFQKAVELLKINGYQRTSDKLTSPIIGKHYPRLFNENKTAAVEVHKEMVKKNGALHFNYKSVLASIILKNNIHFLGKQEQLALTILTKQYNDYGNFYKTISLRNSYDVYLLSLEINTIKSIINYKYFYDILNNYLAYSALFLNVKSILFKKTSKNKLSIRIFLRKLKYPLYGKLHYAFWKNVIYVNLKFKGLIRFISNSEFRKYYIKKLKS